MKYLGYFLYIRKLTIILLLHSTPNLLTPTVAVFHIYFFYFYFVLHIDHTMTSLPQKNNKCTLHLTFTWLWILKQNVSFHTGSLQFLMVLVRTVSGEAVGKYRLMQQSVWLTAFEKTCCNQQITTNILKFSLIALNVYSKLQI